MLGAMTTLTPQFQDLSSRTGHGIGCVVVGMTLFVGQDALMKSLLGEYPLWILMAIRSAVAVAVLVPLIIILGGPHRLRSPNWRLHLLRAALFSGGFSLFYAAFPFMGLAKVTTIFFSAPLMIALIAAAVLREPVGRHRAGALIAGFAGVVIAINPGGGGVGWTALLPLTCAAFYATGQVLARRIGDSESSLTVGLWTLLFAGPIVLATGWALNQVISFGPEFSHLRWQVPTSLPANPWVPLVLGGLGMAGYTTLSRAYQIADASVIAPFDYSYLPIAALVAWLLWGEVPTMTTLIGMALIVSSGLYIAWRELRAERPRDASAMVAESVTAPGSPFATPDGAETP